MWSKVRGVFDSIRKLKYVLKYLNLLWIINLMYIAQVGCWCPWSPNPDDITIRRYAEI
jgi:hypothetical protein